MRLRNVNDLIKTGNIYGIRMFARYDLPFNVLLKAYQPLLKTKVCDVLGLDIEQVVADMCNNWEYYCYDTNCEIIPWTMHVVNKDAKVWYANAEWCNNQKHGGMFETFACIDLNELFSIKYEYCSKANCSKAPNGAKVIEYVNPVTDTVISVWAEMATTIFDENKDKLLPNGQCREHTIDEAICFFEYRKLKMHGGRCHSHMERSGMGIYRFFDNEQECKEYVDSIFNSDTEKQHESQQIIDDYLKLFKSKTELSEKVDNINKEMKILSDRYKVINNTEIHT